MRKLFSAIAFLLTALMLSPALPGRAAEPPQQPPSQQAPQQQPAPPRATGDDNDTSRQAVRDARDTIRDARQSIRDARDNGRDARDVRRRRPFRDLGINLGDVTNRGLAIAKIISDEFGGASGLQEGDTVVSVNGHRVERTGDFERYLYNDDQNAPLKVTVVRNGAERTIELNAGGLYEDPAREKLAWFGVTIDDHFPDRVVIRRVLPGSPAARAGLLEGDDITSWQGKPLRNGRELSAVLSGATPGAVDFEYSRDAKMTRARVELPRRDDRPTENVVPREARRPTDNRNDASPAPNAPPRQDAPPAGGPRPDQR